MTAVSPWGTRRTRPTAAGADPLGLGALRPIDGEMLRLIRSKDWSETPLGAIDTWPLALRQMVDVVLAAPMACNLLWGPELLQIYNDAHREAIGEYHPEALGQPALKTWSGLADTIATNLESVWAGSTLSLRDLRLTLGIEGPLNEGYLDVDHIPVFDDDGGICGVLITSIDRTTTLQAQRALEDSERRLSAAIEAGQAGAFEWALPPDETTYLAPRWLSILGYSELPVPSSQVVAWLEERLHPDDGQCRREECAALVEGEISASDLTIRYRHRDGHWIWVRELSNTLERDAKGRALRVGGIIVDVTRRVETEAKIRYLSEHDPLTGLVNRRLFTKRLDGAIDAAARDNGQVALMMVDLVKFKQVNDMLGHAVGDALLSELAARIAAETRETDTVARMGGDEFAIVLPGIMTAEDLVPLSARIGAAISRPVEIEGNLIEMEASMGAAIFPDDGTCYEQLMRHAGFALRHAKQAQLGAICLFQPQLAAEANRRAHLESALRRAIQQKALEVHYQSQFGIQTGEVICVEALVRWRRGGRLFPAQDFIPLAETSGAIRPLGAWLLEEVCQQHGRWRAAGRAPVIGVNISPAEVTSAQFPNLLEEILDRHDVDGTGLEFEITEGFLMDPGQRNVRDFFDLCASRKIRLAIDDFGTGYSSLSYLASLPAARIKIDRSFVRNIGSRDGDTMLEAMVDLGHRLGKTVVAEGVETEAQLSFLIGIGCDAVQGYFLHRPSAASGVDLASRVQFPDARTA